jgi:hypothetical protein
MVEYRGYCRPLHIKHPSSKGKVDFEVEAVNSFDTAKGVKWQVKGTHNDYNISVFTSEGKAKELLTLMAEKNVHEAEDIIITYDMEELIPYPVAAAEDEEAEALGYLNVDINEGEDFQAEGLDPKYLKKDGSPDMRYKASREWVKLQETTEIVEVSVAPHVGLNLEGPPHLAGMVDVWESEGIPVENKSSFEAETKELIPFIGATRVIPKAVYYQMALHLPQSVSVTPTQKGESIILGFHEQDYSRVEGLLNAYGIPEGGPKEEEGISMFQAEAETTLPLPAEWAEDLSNFSAENIPLEAEEFYGEETEVMSLDEYYSNVMDFKDSDTVNVDFAGNVIVKSNEGGIYDGEEFEAPLEPDHLCITCGNLLQEFTHNCINPSHTHPVYGCVICDDVCSFCDKQTQIESFQGETEESFEASSFKDEEPICPKCGSDDVMCEYDCTYHECVECGYSEGIKIVKKCSECGKKAPVYEGLGRRVWCKNCAHLAPPIPKPYKTERDAESFEAEERLTVDELSNTMKSDWIAEMMAQNLNWAPAVENFYKVVCGDSPDNYEGEDMAGAVMECYAQNWKNEDYTNWVFEELEQHGCTECRDTNNTIFITGIYQGFYCPIHDPDPDIGNAESFDAELLNRKELEKYLDEEFYPTDTVNIDEGYIAKDEDEEGIDRLTVMDKKTAMSQESDAESFEAPKKNVQNFASEIKILEPCLTCGKESSGHPTKGMDVSDDPCECFHCSDCGIWVKWDDDDAWPGFNCPQCGSELGAESFKEWSEEELKEKDHPDKDVTFDNWLNEEIEEHGDVKLSVWKDREHEEKEHQAEDDWEDFEEGTYEDDWEPDFPEFEDKPKLSTVATIVGVGALAAYLAPNEIKNILKKLR